MGLKRGGFGQRNARLAARVPLKSDPASTARWLQQSRTELPRTVGLQPGAGPKRSQGGAGGAKTPQQQRAAAKAAAWPKVRDLVLERDEFACVRCGRTDLRLEVHHRRHRSAGGEDVPSNLVSLCGYGNHSRGDELCHGWAHDRANTDAAAVGLSVVWGADALEVDVLYPDGVRYLLSDDGSRRVA